MEKLSVHDHLFMTPKIMITCIRSDHNWAPMHDIVPQGATIIFKHTLDSVFALANIILTGALLVPCSQIACDRYNSAHMFISGSPVTRD